MGLIFHDSESLLIRHGEAVKTVQSRLGHATAAETLDTYSHLWPDSDDRTREAVDTVLRRPAVPGGGQVWEQTRAPTRGPRKGPGRNVQLRGCSAGESACKPDTAKIAGQRR